MADDGKSETTFIIFDRDGIDKTLIVNDDNRAEAADSWRLAWEKQQAKQN
jgi:hypothetical protein